MKRFVVALAAVAAIAVGVAAVASALSGKPSPPPATIVVFDALPIQLLEDAHGSIDATRFPNFAALAAHSTWYRHATTISESTRFSVPAILDGRKPRPHVAADYPSHPRNLFTLLRGRYRMNVTEEATALCPVPVCPPRSKLNVLQRLRHGRVTRFRHGVGAISDGDQPQLTFLHVLFPHEPRQYFPDGTTYADANTPDALSGVDSMDREFLTQQVEQRVLLQLEYTDRLLGELIARMKSEGVWDKSLFAVVSDHGESFRVKNGKAAPFRIGQLSYRRSASTHNLQDIAGIAMFVKYPDQREGKADDRFVRSVDLLPTILKATDTRRPAGLMGTALNDPAYRGHDDVQVYKQDGRLLQMSTARFLARVRMSKQRELGLFGSGAKSLFDFGPAPQLRGTPVDELQVEAPGHLRARVANAKLFANVRRSSGFVPAQPYGRLSGGRTDGHTLLFALNGTVVATAPSFAAVGPGKWNFSAILPPDAFRTGANRLEILEWLGDQRARRLYG